MKDWHLLAFALLLLGSVNAWGWLGYSAATRQPARPTYELRVAAYPDGDSANAMAEDGKEGWRPVSCRRAVDEVSPKTIAREAITRAVYECILERRR